MNTETEFSTSQEPTENPLLGFYDKMAPLLFGEAMRIVRDEELAQKALFKVFSKMGKESGSYDTETLDSKMKAIRRTRHEALEITKGHEFEQRVVGRTFNFIEFQKTKGTGEKKLEISMDDLKPGMDEKSRLVLDLAYFYGLNEHEIEEQLNIPTGTVKPRLRRAMRELRTIIDTHSPSPSK